MGNYFGPFEFDEEHRNVEEVIRYGFKFRPET